MKPKIKINTLFFRAILTIFIALCLFCIGQNKYGYHIDEIYTFGLSNNTFEGSINPSISSEIRYTGKELLNSYMAVEPGTEFDYANVFTNQANDVHPPLYYRIIHTLSSFFSGEYFPALGLIPNIIFGVIVFWQIVYLFQDFCSPVTSVIFGIAYIGTMGFVNSIMFFRMYVLLTVFTNAVFVLLLKNPPRKDNDYRFYAKLYLSILGGMLTQYYFSIVCAVACAIYAIQLLIGKRLKKLILFVFTGLFAVATAILIFPEMLWHIFRGYRGDEAFSSFLEDSLLPNLREYFSVINQQLFGNLLIFILILIFVSLIAAYIKNHKCDRHTIYFFIQAALPALIYVCFMAKISPYKTDRYIMNVMGILFISVFGTLLSALKAYGKKAVFVSLLFASLSVIFSYSDGVRYLSSSSKKHADIMIEHSDTPCLYFHWYRNKWLIMSDFNILQYSDDLVFIENSTIEYILEEDAYKNYDELIIFIEDTEFGDDICQQLIDINPDLNSFKELATIHDNIIYYFE